MKYYEILWYLVGKTNFSPDFIFYILFVKIWIHVDIRILLTTHLLNSFLSLTKPVLVRVMLKHNEKNFFLLLNVWYCMCILHLGWSTRRHVDLLRRKATTRREIGMFPCYAPRSFSACTKRSSTCVEITTRGQKGFRSFTQVNTVSIVILKLEVCGDTISSTMVELV